MNARDGIRNLGAGIGSGHMLPQSALGKARDYALRQWKRLCVFLENGRIEIDNNRCENAIRPIALGRKNWLHLAAKRPDRNRRHHVGHGNMPPPGR